MSLLLVSRHLPANFRFWGFGCFVLDGTVDEVFFEPPPSRFTSLLVGEPKNLPCFIRRRLPLMTGISVVLVVVESSGFDVFGRKIERERKREEVTKERVNRCSKDGSDVRERLKKG
jgi:hypothetical protein